ncbi:ABC transporter permease subunit [Corynebacterium sp. 320]|uniref:ABC transporter permease subunit n=1 Tax=Corynebacterium TaxID=1716 RepID=UPI00125CBD0B|nr:MULTISPECIES: ABC transporter permease subunit [Corynebacterium]KAB1503084.1 ABC transporter permease subunit [Corynebacterium sp. 320]KAB1550705.1 ABC transporter permease subunit [Corynebacterium sp. 321]KAB1551064.1 ABC transporter permease subunit [Corynebacterium sp. 319]KAB3526881.1 ABC transporter permease subunit [Corynebacterium sp. 250]KAB3538374.1 ABC transporter permease subunit [Corynebacterium sp. 366]
MLNVMKAEWIKLRSTKGLWWTSALIIFFSVALALLMGLTSGWTLKDNDASSDPMEAFAILGMLRPNVALTGLSTFGVMIILIQGVMTVTSEYAHSTQKMSVLSTPARWKLAVAKLGVYGAIAVVVSFIAALLSILGMELTFRTQIDNDALLDLVGFSAAYVWGYIGRTVLYAFLSAMIAIGVGYLIRNTAGAIALLLLWKMIVETVVVGLIPKVRDVLPQWMPFSHMDNYVARMPVEKAVWHDTLGQTGSALYFALWCVVIFAAGVVALNKRDA